MTAGKLWLALGAAYGLLGVALGAFGAHALKDRLAGDLLAVWRTAVEYHFWHALALVGVGVLALQRPARALGAVTPIGGVLFLCGWAALLWAAIAE